MNMFKKLACRSGKEARIAMYHRECDNMSPISMAQDVPRGNI